MAEFDEIDEPLTGTHGIESVIINLFNLLIKFSHGVGKQSIFSFHQKSIPS